MRGRLETPNVRMVPYGFSGLSATTTACVSIAWLTIACGNWLYWPDGDDNCCPVSIWIKVLTRLTVTVDPCCPSPYVTFQAHGRASLGLALRHRSKSRTEAAPSRYLRVHMRNPAESLRGRLTISPDLHISLILFIFATFGDFCDGVGEIIEVLLSTSIFGNPWKMRLASSRVIFLSFGIIN